MECDFSFHLLSTARIARRFYHSARVFPDLPFSVNAWLVVRVVGLLYYAPVKECSTDFRGNNHQAQAPNESLKCWRREQKSQQYDFQDWIYIYIVCPKSIQLRIENFRLSYPWKPMGNNGRLL